MNPEKVNIFHKQMNLIAAENNLLGIEQRVLTITVLEQRLMSQG